MGYETRIYIVEIFGFQMEAKINGVVHEVDTGKVLAQIDLCKAGYEGPVPALLEKSKPTYPLFALHVDGPSQQQEAAEFIRDLQQTLPSVRHTIIEKEAYRLWDEAGRPHHKSLDFWYQAEKDLNLFLPELSDLDDLARALEDGYILTDRYGDYLGVHTVEEFLTALEEELAFGEEYRRFRLAYDLIKSIKDSPNTFNPKRLRIISYGH